MYDISYIFMLSYHFSFFRCNGCIITHLCYRVIFVDVVGIMTVCYRLIGMLDKMILAATCVGTMVHLMS